MADQLGAVLLGLALGVMLSPLVLAGVVAADRLVRGWRAARRRPVAAHLAFRQLYRPATPLPPAVSHLGVGRPSPPAGRPPLDLHPYL